MRIFEFMKIFSLLCGALGLLGGSTSGWAQSPTASPLPSAAESPAGIQSSDAFEERSAAGVVLGAQNAAQYRSFIVPELYATVRAGNIEMDAMSRLAYEPATALSSDKATDVAARPEEFLKAVSGLLADLKILDGDFAMYALHDEKLQMQLKGSLLRVYPTAAIVGDKSVQLFREKIRVTAPTALAGFHWLTLRFGTPDEDFVWLYSPAIKKVRQLTGADRTAGLLRTGFTLDDIFTWSGKVELVAGEQVTKVTALVPFPEAQISPGSLRGQCVEVKQEQSSEGELRALRWNFSSRRFPEAAGWLPTDAVFVPRELIRIELKSLDPYSVYGRQILYVDAKRMLPVYKFVFDRLGRPWKTVISAFGEILAADQKGHLPTYAFTVVDDALSGDSFILDFTRFASCNAPPEGVTFADFDPRKLAPDWVAEKAVEKTIETTEPSVVPSGEGRAAN